MGTLHFTSDTHFGHRLVSGLRGFADTGEHDQAIVERWNRAVHRDDTVYLLGDICIGGTEASERALGIMAGLNGTKHLIAGNHDLVSSINRHGWKHTARFLEVFASVRDFARLRIAGRLVLLSHYPYPGPGADHTEQARHLQFRLPDMGQWLLHGHTHLPEQRVHGTQIHVGLDAWDLAPVPLITIENILTSTDTSTGAVRDTTLRGAQ